MAYQVHQGVQPQVEDGGRGHHGDQGHGRGRGGHPTEHPFSSVRSRDATGGGSGGRAVGRGLEPQMTIATQAIVASPMKAANRSPAIVPTLPVSWVSAEP